MLNILTVTTPATSYRLTTLAKLSDSIGTAALGCDDILEEYLDRASGIICAYLDVPRAEDGTTTLASEELVERIQLDEASNSLTLARYPIVAVDSVTVAGEVIADTDYLVRKAFGEILRMDADGNQSDWPASAIILIEYTAGWTLPGVAGRNLPYDIEDCCLRIAQRLWFDRERDTLLKSEQYVGVLSFNYQEAAEGLYADELNMIHRYRRYLP